MQSNEMEFELSPSILNTPSLLTPNLLQNNNNPNNTNPLKLVYNIQQANSATEQNTLPDSNPSSIPTTVTNSVTTSESSSSSSSSGDVKLSRIEDDLKKSAFARQPTPSPFAAIATSNGAISSIPYASTNESSTVTEVPSTADVVLALESLTNMPVGKYLTKPLTNDNSERELTTLINDSARCDSSPLMNTSHLTSPKKIFLIRSQSITDATSPVASTNSTSNTNPTHSQRLTHGDMTNVNLSADLDDDNSMEDSISSQFSRNPEEISSSANSNGAQHSTYSSNMTNGTDGLYSIQQHPIIKQQATATNVAINNKRQYHQTIPVAMTKSTQIIIPQPAVTNEVTSSDQSLSSKRQKTNSSTANSNVMNFRSTTSAAAAATSGTILATAHSPNGGGGSDDQRKKQIRDSNREAARRCRERRRQYIEQLEGNLEQSKSQIKQLSDKITRIERENLQLRALLSETKLLHPTARLATSDNVGDYVDVIATNEIGLNAESNHQTDGGLLQRNFINRNNL